MLIFLLPRADAVLVEVVAGVLAGVVVEAAEEVAVSEAEAEAAAVGTSQVIRGHRHQDHPRRRSGLQRLQDRRPR